MFKKLFAIFVVVFCWNTIFARTIYDSKGIQVSKLFNRKNIRYVIRYHHVFIDTLKIPANCEICFKGGSLRGPIMFKGTKLTGNVNMKGASIHGSLRNALFDASWLCYKDGINDDAKSINEMIDICGKIFFPKGNYCLKSKYIPTEKLPGKISCHIGINRHDVSLKGEENTCFITKEPLGTICIYSLPGCINTSTRNISIKNITFIVNNDGKNFYEFMHTIRTIGVNGLIIENCKFIDFWGDAVCLSSYNDTPKTGERTRNQNVRIINNQIIGGRHHNNRNGISVVSGKNIVISGNTIKSTSRDDMPGAIDIEPNNSAYTIDNIKVLNNTIIGCRGTAGGICVHANDRGGPAHHIVIRNNRLKDCTSGLSFVVKQDNTTSDYTITNNYVASDTRPFQFVGEGRSKNWIFSDNVFKKSYRQKIPGKIKVQIIQIKRNHQ